MRLRLMGALCLAFIFSLLAIRVGAQTIPRTADGKPDLSGIWQASMNGTHDDILPHSASADAPAG